MRFKVFVTASIGILFMLTLANMTGAVRSQDPVPQGAAATAGSGISYQGYLADASGNPLEGSHQLGFKLYNKVSGGSALWQKNYSNVAIVDGLVDLVLDVDPSIINGQALWLEISVDGQTLAPRQELLPVPYALSVRPGASIVGDISAPILSIHNDNNVGVWASSSNESPVVGKIDNPASQHSAIAGLTEGEGNGLFGLSEGGIGVFGHTNDDTAWVAAGVYGTSIHDNTFGVLGKSDWGIGLEGRIDNPENGNPAIVGFNLGSGPAIYGYGRDDTIPDLVLGGDEDQDDGLLTSDLGHPGSDIVIASNDAVVIALDDNNDEEGHFVVVNGNDEITLLGDESGNLEVTGDLTVEGSLNAWGPTCTQFGPFSHGPAHLLEVPPFCINQLCWIIVQSDATFGAFSPGMYWPVLYMQDSASGDWVGGPSVNIAGMDISHGSGTNGDNNSEIIAPSGLTENNGRLMLWDDGGSDSQQEQWYLDFVPKAGELSTATIYACPMGRPQVP